MCRRMIVCGINIISLRLAFASFYLDGENILVVIKTVSLLGIFTLSAKRLQYKSTHTKRHTHTCTKWTWHFVFAWNCLEKPFHFIEFRECVVCNMWNIVWNVKSQTNVSLYVVNTLQIHTLTKASIKYVIHTNEFSNAHRSHILAALLLLTKQNSNNNKWTRLALFASRDIRLRLAKNSVKMCIIEVVLDTSTFLVCHVPTNYRHFYCCC